MDDHEVGRFWDENAAAWTRLARAGYDIYRDHLNTPAFFEMLPDVQGLYGIDIGCGEGYNTRLLAKSGAKMHAIDISDYFIQKAKEQEQHEQSGIGYVRGSAQSLPFTDQQFDFATSFMCLMDVPDPLQALREAFRVLKPGGFLQFSITHPCFNTPHRKLLRGPDHKAYAVEVGGYFQKQDGKIEEWLFSAAPAQVKAQLPKFRIPLFNRTLTEWFNNIIQAGFTIEQINEPFASEDVVALYPALQDTQVVSYFLHIRCRKPYR